MVDEEWMQSIDQAGEGSDQATQLVAVSRPWPLQRMRDACSFVQRCLNIVAALVREYVG